MHHFIQTLHIRFSVINCTLNDKTEDLVLTVFVFDLNRILFERIRVPFPLCALCGCMSCENFFGYHDHALFQPCCSTSLTIVWITSIVSQQLYLYKHWMLLMIAVMHYCLWKYALSFPREWINVPYIYCLVIIVELFNMMTVYHFYEWRKQFPPVFPCLFYWKKMSWNYVVLQTGC